MTVTVDEITANYIRQDTGPWADIVHGLELASTDVCVDCGYPLGGFCGTFAWGIQHGVGYCVRCEFPYQYYHRFPRPDGQGDVVLQAFVPIAEIPLEEVVP